MDRRRFLAAVGASASGFAGCLERLPRLRGTPPESGDGWPLYQYDARNTGATPATGPAEPVRTSGPLGYTRGIRSLPRRSFPRGGFSSRPLATVRSRQAGRDAPVDLPGGRSGRHPPYSGALVSHGERVCYGTPTGIVALDVSDGTKRWEYGKSDQESARPRQRTHLFSHRSRSALRPRSGNRRAALESRPFDRSRVCCSGSSRRRPLLRWGARSRLCSGGNQLIYRNRSRLSQSPGR